MPEKITKTLLCPVLHDEMCLISTSYYYARNVFWMGKDTKQWFQRRIELKHQYACDIASALYVPLLCTKGNHAWENLRIAS